MGIVRTFRGFVRKVPAAFVALALAGVVRAQVPVFDIPAQDAAGGLAAFSEQTQLQLVFDYEAVQGITTRGVSGTLRVSEALSRLLTGTGLAFEVVNDRTISIVRDPRARRES